MSVLTETVCVSDLSVSDSVGYCRGSDFLMDVNYLHYLLDARQAVSTSLRLDCLTVLFLLSEIEEWIVE